MVVYVWWRGRQRRLASRVKLSVRTNLHISKDGVWRWPARAESLDHEGATDESPTEQGEHWAERRSDDEERYRSLLRAGECAVARGAAGERPRDEDDQPTENARHCHEVKYHGANDPNLEDGGRARPHVVMPIPMILSARRGGERDLGLATVECECDFAYARDRGRRLVLDRELGWQQTTCARAESGPPLQPRCRARRHRDLSAAQLVVVHGGDKEGRRWRFGWRGTNGNFTRIARN